MRAQCFCICRAQNESKLLLLKKDEPDRSLRPPRDGTQRISALAIVLEPHDATASQQKELFQSELSTPSWADLGEQTGMAVSWRFCGYQEDPRPVVSGVEHRKPTLMTDFWTVWNGRPQTFRDGGLEFVDSVR